MTKDYKIEQEVPTILHYKGSQRKRRGLDFLYVRDIRGADWITTARENKACWETKFF